MFNKLIELFTHGDVDKLTPCILHSTSWRQHDFTSYGNAQIETQWLQSIEQFGFSQVVVKRSVHGTKFSALYVELSKDNCDQELSISLFFEHNGSHIKRVNCIVDTIALARLLQRNEKELAAELPTPDPLQISPFDHQLHTQSHHAKPFDITELPNGIARLVNQWWRIWQEKQIAGLDSLYAENLTVKIAGSPASSNFVSIRDFRIKLNNSLNRSYSQLENICFDPMTNTVAITWQIDGDYNDDNQIKRIRIPAMSFLTFAEDKIIEEYLQIDWLSLGKRFHLNTLLI